MRQLRSATPSCLLPARYFCPGLLLGLALGGCAGEVSGGAPPDGLFGRDGDGTAQDTSQPKPGSANTADGNAATGDVGAGDMGDVRDVSSGDMGDGEAGTGDVTTGDVGTGDVAVGDVGTGDVTTGDGPAGPPEPALAARIRRLTTLELVAAIANVFPAVPLDTISFVPDARQGSYNAHGGYRRNAAQVVDPVFARQLQELSQEIGAAIAANPSAFASCAATADRACAESTLASWVPLAFHRPAEAGEVDALLALYDLGAEASFGEGLALAAQGLLQSPHFLYLTELGEKSGAGAGVVRLTAGETAAQLAFFLTGGPPDAELLAQGEALLDPSVRASEARRLLQTVKAKEQVARMVKEWLSIDNVGQTAKSRDAFPDVDFDALRGLMDQETSDFVTEVVYEDDGTVKTMLSASYTVAAPELARFYGLAAPGADGRVSLSGSNRLGILTQGTFLATHATEIDSAPVRRGNSVLRQVLCRQTPDPSTVVLNVDVTFPAPDASATTRERFEQHLSIEECRACHAAMDPIGFSFEHFDAVGRERSTENGMAIDSSGLLPAGLVGSSEVSFGDSQELLAALSESATAARCFATNAARFLTAVSSPAVESGFLQVYDAMDEQARGSIQDILVEFAASELFVERKAGGV